MKRTPEELREYALSLVDDIEFVWNGMQGLIIPFNREKFIMRIQNDDPGTEFHSVDEMMQAPCFIGKSLNEICDKVEFLR